MINKIFWGLFLVWLAVVALAIIFTVVDVPHLMYLALYVAWGVSAAMLAMPLLEHGLNFIRRRK